MIKITKENIIPYLKEHLPDFDDSLPVNISMVGEGTEEEDGDGYAAFLYRQLFENFRKVIGMVILQPAAHHRRGGIAPDNVNDLLSIVLCLHLSRLLSSPNLHTETTVFCINHATKRSPFALIHACGIFCNLLFT